MNQTILLFLLGSAVALLLVLSGILFALYLKKQPPREPGPPVHTSLKELRAIGELSVFKALTKETVTATEHSLGEFGRKYLSLILSSKKMIMIFEFDIDFRYDLRSSEFEIVPAGPGSFLFRMPPCFHEAHIRDVYFYDEQHSKILPSLLPDLLNDILGLGFSDKDRNKLVVAAKSHAEEQAKRLIESLSGRVETSAKETLQAIARAFGAEHVDFVFKPNSDKNLNIKVEQQTTG
jgi:hypothetical protein